RGGCRRTPRGLAARGDPREKRRTRGGGADSETTGGGQCCVHVALHDGGGRTRTRRLAPQSRIVVITFAAARLSVAVLIGILCTDWNAHLVKGEGGMMWQVKSTYSTR